MGRLPSINFLIALPVISVIRLHQNMDVPRQWWIQEPQDWQTLPSAN